MRWARKAVRCKSDVRQSPSSSLSLALPPGDDSRADRVFSHVAEEEPNFPRTLSSGDKRRGTITRIRTSRVHLLPRVCPVRFRFPTYRHASSRTLARVNVNTSDNLDATIRLFLFFRAYTGQMGPRSGLCCVNEHALAKSLGLQHQAHYQVEVRNSLSYSDFFLFSVGNRRVRLSDCFAD